MCTLLEFIQITFFLFRNLYLVLHTPDDTTLKLMFFRLFLTRWRECIFMTTSSLSFAVGYSYVSRFFDNEAKKSVSHSLHIVFFIYNLCFQYFK
jgi:hypothetical protein